MTAIDLALLIIRVDLGITFILHGGQKLFGWYGGSGIKGTTDVMNRFGVAHPTHLAWMAALSEFVGGLLVLIGLLTPVAAAFIISTMLTAINKMHFRNGFFNTNRGYEFNLALSTLGLALILEGAGTISIDHLLGIARPLDQLPAWVAVVLVIIIGAGVLSTEASRRAKVTGKPSADQKQGA